MNIYGWHGCVGFVARRGAVPAVILLFLAAVGYPLFAGPAGSMRGGWPNFNRHLSERERVRLQYYGGGVLAGQGLTNTAVTLSSRTTRTFYRTFERPNLEVRNASRAGAHAWRGALNIQSDFLRPHVRMGLVVLEFASEDVHEPPARTLAALEGLVRHVRGMHPRAELLLLAAAGPGDLERYARGETPPAVAVMESVADHYGLPSVNLGAMAAACVAAGDAAATAFNGPDGYPDEHGHALYAGWLHDFILEITAQPIPEEPVTYTLPPRLSPQALDRGQRVSYEMSALDPGWLDWQESPVAEFLHVAHGTVPGDTLTFRFRGTAVALQDAWGPDTADLEYALDDGAWQRLSGGGAAEWRERVSLLAEGLCSDTEHRLVIRLPSDAGTRSGRVAFFLVNGEPVWTDPFRGLSPAQRHDAIYATMEPVRYTPPPDRWKHLGRTMETLRRGPELTLVMLGDSIVNDTSRSAFEHLLMRHYPDCKIRKITSVAGGAGCAYFLRDDRLQTVVIDHQPDLLLIGGISQRGDIDSIRETIHRVRAAWPEIEILLMTGAFGRADPRSDPNWTFEVPSEGDSYRTRLKALAAEENCAFMDFTGPWGQYIRASEFALGAFKRDPVHANFRGEQILGKLLEIYFTDASAP